MYRIITCVLLSVSILNFFGCDSSSSQPGGDDPPAEVIGTLLGGAADDEGYDIIRAHNNGYIVAAVTESYGSGGSDIYIVKVNEALGIAWEATFGGAGNETVYSVARTSDGGYIIGGTTSPQGSNEADVFLIKINQAGAELWSHTYNLAGDEGRCNVRQTRDGGYVFSAWRGRESGNDADFYVVKTDANGAVTWEKSFGYDQDDGPNDLIIDSDGNIVIYGEGNWDTTGEWQGIMLKLDTRGNEIWSSTFGGNGPEEGYGLCEAGDGGYVATGFSNSSGPTAYLIKADRNGNELWFRNITGLSGFAVKLAADNGLIVVSHPWNLTKTDAAGSMLWNQSFSNGDASTVRNVCLSWDGGYVMVGQSSENSAGGTDIYIIKTDSQGNPI